MTQITAMTAAAVLAGAAAAPAQIYFGSFEQYLMAASPAGIPLEGQNSWFIPFGGLGGHSAFTYAGNTHGLAAPTLYGGSQFVAGRAGAAGPALAERGILLLDSDTWTFSWLVTVKPDGTPTGTEIGSFSLEPFATSRTFRARLEWLDTGATAWRCVFGVFDAAGAPLSASGVLPGPAWTNLAPGAWYLVSVDASWAASSNRVLSVAITDMASGATATVQPAGWYMRAGAAPLTMPKPAAHRFTAAPGGAAVVAWDRLRVLDFCYPDCNHSGHLSIADYGCFRAAVASGSPYADCNSSGSITIADFACFQGAFASGLCR